MKSIRLRLASLMLASLVLTGCGGAQDSLPAAGTAGVPAAQQTTAAGEFVLPYIAAEGFDIITPMVICNSDNFKEVKTYTGSTVAVGDKVMGLVK